MKKNVGKTDRTIRIMLALAIFACGVYFKSWLGIIGVVPLVTAFVSWCPIYVPFGMSSCRTKEKS